ncbi:MAG: DUF4998 domain-containing protein [Ignavibacteriaceae bacterium]|jgi:hypothetical protein|nr:DUF4998 domain-containing protein [Ignavibacteriaceae bacterium]
MKTNIQKSHTLKQVFVGLLKPVKLLTALFVMVLAGLLVGCDNEEEVEVIYQLNAVDSIKVISGDMRAHVTFWVSESKTKKVIFYWFPTNVDTVEFDITDADLGKPINFTLGEADSVQIAEGKYNLKAVSFDAAGNRSAISWVEMHIYGNEYKNGLTNRRVKAVDYNQSAITLVYDNPVNNDDIGVLINYIDNYGTNKKAYFSNELLKEPVSVENVDLSKEAYFQTLYVPESNALDTFPAELVLIAGSQNIAQNKTATSSGHYLVYLPKYAVDGIKNVDLSRWTAKTATGPHWLEIDLGEEYQISAYQAYLYKETETISTPENDPPFQFQALVNDSWLTLDDVTTRTSQPVHKVVFPEEVTTSKVRIYIPGGTFPNKFQLYELEVFAFMKLNIE